ncbi:hypothetical protein KCU89_g13108, partial [Aureobasidium melanogenum]
MPERPVLSLFSPIYEDTGRPFPYLILIEVQFAKNQLSKTHQAIKQLPYGAVICVSGTILPNQTEQEFVRVFASRYGNQVRDPLPTKRTRLIKFLLAFAIGHPASILRILDAVYTTFYEAMRFMKAPGLSAIQTDDDAINAQANAVRAQQWAGHPALFKVISSFVEFLDLVAEAFIRNTKTLAFRFDGTSSHPPILVTAGAGGAGMNLQAGNHDVRCERWWTESEEMQADARCHRKNQAKQVRVWTMEGKTSPIDDGTKQTRDRKAAAKAVNVQGKRLLR